MKVRITSAGWEKFSGNFGFQTPFKDGVSVNDLNARQIARIGSSVRIVDAETGEQVGPAQVALLLQGKPLPTAPVVKTLDVVKVDQERERAALAAAEVKRKAEEKAALAEAEANAAAERKETEIVVYTRAELEAIGANNGIQGLRDIAKPLNVKGRGITELVNEILKAQTSQAVA